MNRKTLIGSLLVTVLLVFASMIDARAAKVVDLDSGIQQGYCELLTLVGTDVEVFTVEYQGIIVDNPVAFEGVYVVGSLEPMLVSLVRPVEGRGRAPPTITETSLSLTTTVSVKRVDTPNSIEPLSEEI